MTAKRYNSPVLCYCTNKMHYASHQHTAAEVIYHRVDSKANVGMTNFKGDYITRDDGKNSKELPLRERITV